MLGLIFAILLAVFVIKAIILAVRLAWGLFRIIIRIVFFPLALVWMVASGLMTVALPLVIIAVVIVLIVK